MHNNIKAQLLSAVKKLAASDVIPENAFVSVKDAEAKCFAVNNILLPIKDASENNIIIIDFDGNVLAGDSNGIDPYFTVHKTIYAENDEITTVINPRSRWNSIWAELGYSLVPSSFLYTKNFSGEILCTGAAMLEPGEDLYEIIGKTVTTRLAYKGFQSRGAIIIRNDSAMVWGKNPEATAGRAITLEEICFRAIQTTSITNGSNTFVAWEVSEQLLVQE